VYPRRSDAAEVTLEQRHFAGPLLPTLQPTLVRCREVTIQVSAACNTNGANYCKLGTAKVREYSHNPYGFEQIRTNPAVANFVKLCTSLEIFANIRTDPVIANFANIRTNPAIAKFAKICTNPAIANFANIRTNPAIAKFAKICTNPAMLRLPISRIFAQTLQTSQMFANIRNLITSNLARICTNTADKSSDYFEFLMNASEYFLVN
jgi:hypothetical protein